MEFRLYFFILDSSIRAVASKGFFPINVNFAIKEEMKVPIPIDLLGTINYKEIQGGGGIGVEEGRISMNKCFPFLIKKQSNNFM